MCNDGDQHLFFQSDQEHELEPEPEPEMEAELELKEGDAPYIEDEAAIFFDDEEDLECTLYRVRLGKGKLELYESLEGGVSQGLIQIAYSEFQATFVPSVVRMEDTYVCRLISTYSKSESWPVEEGETPPPRVEASLVIGHYTITTLDPGPSKHPNYLTLVYYLYEVFLKSFRFNMTTVSKKTKKGATCYRWNF